ncbi:MAG: tRNA pseudouridine(38-40) synthase TruA [Bacteroidales bacterium]
MILLLNTYLCGNKTRLTRYFIYISFKGSSYHGWQNQPNSETVQKILEMALSLIVGEYITSTGAGRTDAGVHAKIFCAHFDSSRPGLDTDKNLIFKLNRFLPHDIAVSSIRKVKPDVNARFSAISRTYKYFINLEKDPFCYESSWYLYGQPDLESMKRASELLLRHSDFTSFSRLHSDNKTSICRILSAGWESDGSYLVFTIKADRFLRNMVRAIVGTMVDLGYGKISIEEFEKIIDARDRSAAGSSAPARGLFLYGIEYPEEIFNYGNI